MRIRAITIAALATVAIAGAGAAPSTSAAAGPHFIAYLSCSAHSPAHASACSLAASPVAVLRAFRRDNVLYKICVRRPNGKGHCGEKRTGARGVRSRQAINLVRPGLYRIAWFVGHHHIATLRLRARAPRVYVIGDSLTVGTDPYLPGDLPGWTVTQTASISRHVPEGVSILRSKGSKLAKIIVMALGTNDDPRSTSDFAHSVRQTIRIAGPDRCVVWPNIVRPPVAGATYAGYNHILSQQQRRHDNFFVPNWVRLAADNPGWFGGDGVHPNATGYMARAALIAAQIKRCV